MNNNKQNVNETLSRMKAMMNYGLTTENKKSYSSVEYSKQGADGKVYGIIREGAKYYIKVSNNSKNIVKENFDYVGGFVNRKDNEYNSYANALKQFDLKMMSLKEAYGNGKNIIIESWNPDRNEELAVESTDKMRKEIMRQRQIMGNATMIHEGKDGCCDCQGGDPFCEKPCDCDDMEGGCCAEKNNVKKEFKVNGDSKQKEVNEAAEVLGWHKTGGDAKETIADTYMDKSHGTEVGNSAPFGDKYQPEEKNGVVEECGSMAYSDNQNNPTPGTGEVGDDAPFDGEKGKQLDESLDDLGDSDMVNDDDTYDAEYDTESDEEAPFGDEDFASEEDAEVEGDELAGDDLGDELGDEEEPETEYELETYDDLDADDDLEGGSDVESRLSSIESTLDSILSKLDALNSSDYDDDSLYDDSEDDFEGDEEMPVDDVDADVDGEMGMDGELDEPMDDEPMDDDMENTKIYESRSYRQMMAEENRLNDFGMHPAYRKQPMKLPTTGEDKNSHARDWNDASVHSESPYGEKIGSGAPFDVDIQDIENSIAECVKRILGNRKNLR